MMGATELIVFAAVFSILLAFRARAPRTGHAVLAQLVRPTSDDTPTDVRRPSRIRLSGDVDGATSFWNNSFVRWLETLMLQAAIYMPVANVVGLMAALLVGGGAGALLLTGDPLIAAAVGIALCIAPLGY